jgi:hypothetical protein
MMRLPFIEDLQGLDAAFVGIPLDIRPHSVPERVTDALYSYRIGNDSPVQHGHRRRAF